MIKQFLKHTWWKFLIVLLIVGLDMLTKFLLVHNNPADDKTYTLIEGVLVILPTRNEGAGFSILSGKVWLLITITSVFLVGFSVFDILYKQKSTLYSVASALIYAGSIGNLIDRIAFGFVRDFIYFEFINFPVFNVADIALTFGAIFMAMYVLFYMKDKPEQTSLDKPEHNSIEKSANEE